MPTVLHPVTSCHNKREFHEKLNNLPIEKGNFLLYKNCNVANFIRTTQRRDGIFKEPSFCKNSHVENIVARWWTLEMFCSSCLENKTSYVSFFFLFNRKRLRHIVSRETLQISSWDCKFFLHPTTFLEKKNRPKKVYYKMSMLCEEKMELACFVRVHSRGYDATCSSWKKTRAIKRVLLHPTP